AKTARRELMTRKRGKVKAEAGGDVQEAIDMLYYMAGEGRRLWWQTTPSALRDKFNMSAGGTVGVVSAITPSNFLTAISSRSPTSTSTSPSRESSGRHSERRASVAPRPRG